MDLNKLQKAVDGLRDFDEFEMILAEHRKELYDIIGYYPSDNDELLETSQLMSQFKKNSYTDLVTYREWLAERWFIVNQLIEYRHLE